MKILSTGSIYLDINTNLIGSHTQIIPEKEYYSTSFEAKLGGSAIIAPLIMAQLGLEPYFVGAVGDDDFGDLVRKKMELSGIKSYLQIVKGAQTNIGINRIDEKGATFMDVLGNANASLSSSNITKISNLLFPNLDAIYLGSIFKNQKLIPTYIKIAEHFHSANKIVFLDHGRAPSNLSHDVIENILADILPHVTHYAPSEEDIISTWNLNSIEELTHRLSSSYPKLQFNIKMGAKGMLVSNSGKSQIIPPYAHVDLSLKPNFVGAGDSCNAGLIYGLSKGMGITQASEIANRVAYLHISNQPINASILR